MTVVLRRDHPQPGDNQEGATRSSLMGANVEDLSEILFYIWDRFHTSKKRFLNKAFKLGSPDIRTKETLR
jgi:hypothetical protein